jgi:tetratricopeptide (TPR) repeat protein
MDGLSTLAEILMIRGRLGEAEHDSRNVLALSDKLGSSARHMASTLRLGYLELRFRNAPDEAVRIVDQGLAKVATDSLDDDAALYDELARFFAAAGRPARARELVVRSERSRLGRLRGLTEERRWSLGMIAVSEGRLHDALPLLQQAANALECPICSLPDLARAYDANGQSDSAIAVYERYLSTPWEFRFETDAFELGWALDRMGELYQERGNTTEAVGANRHLLALWQGADPDLGPVIANVRRRPSMRKVELDRKQGRRRNE